MTCGERAYTKNVNVVFHGLTGSFRGGLEEGTHVYVKSTVGIAGCYYLGATVVTVLTHLGNHDTGLTALLLGKFLTHFLCAAEFGILFCFC